MVRSSLQDKALRMFICLSPYPLLLTTYLDLNMNMFRVPMSNICLATMFNIDGAEKDFQM